MEYLLLIYQGQTRWTQLPDAQQGQIMQEYRAFIQGIVTSCHFRAGARLQPTSIATTVSEKSGKRVITEGPSQTPKSSSGASS
jgi:hypothetical protein